MLKIAKKFEHEIIKKKAKIFNKAEFLRIQEEYDLHLGVMLTKANRALNKEHKEYKLHFSSAFNEADQVLKKLIEGQKLSDNLSIKEKEMQKSLVNGLFGLILACERAFHDTAKQQSLMHALVDLVKACKQIFPNMIRQQDMVDEDMPTV